MTHPTQQQAPERPAERLAGRPVNGLRMPAVNQVSIAGRLHLDPEYRITDSGQARLSFRLEVTRSFRDRDGEWQDESSYFNVILRGEKAETAADTLRRNTPVFVTGRLVAHSWRDEADRPHSIVEIEARQVQTLDPPRGD